MTSLLRSWRQVIKPFSAILASFILGGAILFLAGYNVLDAFSALFGATFRNLFAFTGTINRSSPLIFVGLAVAVAFRGSVFNIGAEGQFLMGAAFATIVGISFKGVPGFLLIPLMIVAGAAGGGFWASIPGYLKARYEVSEVITTIMFNYVALNLVGWLIRGPIKDTHQAEPQSFAIAKQAYLPSILPGTRLHMGFMIGIFVALGLSFLIFKTKSGFELRSVGLSQDAARCAGIDVRKTLTFTMMLSGALAGMGGAIELADIHYLIEGISPGYGYTGISVAVLAGNHPIAVIFTSLLFGALSAGASTMQRTAGVSASFIGIFQGIMIVAIALASAAQGGTTISSKRKRRAPTECPPVVKEA